MLTYADDAPNIHEEGTTAGTCRCTSKQNISSVRKNRATLHSRSRYHPDSAHYPPTTASSVASQPSPKNRAAMKAQRPLPTHIRKHSNAMEYIAA